MARRILLILLLFRCSSPCLAEQEDPPVRLEDPDEPYPRWALSGDFDWSFSNADETALNLSYYGNNLMKLLRVSLLFNFEVSDRLTLVANITSENAETPHLYGAFVRLAPIRDKNLWIQAGKIPPPFGAFPERWYAYANPLVGLPLMYSYPTQLRPDQLPADVDDLVSQRGKIPYPELAGGGSASLRTGMPMVSVLKWDAGGVLFGALGELEYVGGITTGTLSNPRVEDQNGGVQALARVRFRPSPAFNAGLSAARGPYLDEAVEGHLAGADLDAFHQTTLGADAHYGRGHLLLYAEGAWTEWESPTVGEPLRAWSTFVEARYRLLPGLYAAGRLDRMTFSEVAVGDGTTLPWNVPLTRVEVGAGLSWTRYLVLKLVGQFNRFDDASELDEDILGVQVAVHF